MTVRGPLMENPVVQAGDVAETIGIASPGSWVISGFTASAGGTYVNISTGKAYVGGTVVISDTGVSVNSKPNGGIIVLRTRYDMDAQPWIELIPSTATVSLSGGYKPSSINRIPGVAYDLVLYRVDADSQGIISSIYDYAVRLPIQGGAIYATNTKPGYTDIRPGSLLSLGGTQKIWDGDKLIEAGQQAQYSWTSMPTLGQSSVNVSRLKTKTEGSVTTTFGQVYTTGVKPRINFSQSPGTSNAELFIGMSVEEKPQPVKAVWEDINSNIAAIKYVYGGEIPSGTTLMISMAVVR